LSSTRKKLIKGSDYKEQILEAVGKVTDMLSLENFELNKDMIEEIFSKAFNIGEIRFVKCKLGKYIRDNWSDGSCFYISFYDMIGWDN
jgi:dihydroorotase